MHSVHVRAQSNDAFQFVILLLQSETEATIWFTQAQLIMAQCDFKGTFLMTRSGKKSASAVLMTFTLNIYSVVTAQPHRTTLDPFVFPLMFSLKKCVCRNALMPLKISVNFTHLQHIQNPTHPMDVQSEWWESLVPLRCDDLDFLNSNQQTAALVCSFHSDCRPAAEAVALPHCSPPHQPAERHTLNYVNTQRLILTCLPSVRGAASLRN